ncbi:MAG: hypothetical protein ACTSWJ_05545 [Candidatus Heimdallarchaeaceae archaeon]
MINEKTDIEDLMKGFGESVEDDPFMLESEIKKPEVEYNITYIVPRLKQEVIDEELEVVAQMNKCTVEKLKAFSEEKNLIYGYFCGYSKPNGSPVGNVLYAPKNSEYKINDFIYFNSFIGNIGLHCISNADKVSFCTGEGDFINTSSVHVANPFQIKKESKEINDDVLEEFDIESDVDMDSLPVMVKNFIECYMANPDMLKGKFLPIYREIMLNKKIHSFCNGEENAKNYYDAISLYNKIKSDHTKIKYCKDNKISLHLYALDKSSTHNGISADALKSIIAAKNGSKAKKY